MAPPVAAPMAGRRWRRWVAGAAAVALVAAVGVVLLATPLTAVRTITVRGEHHTPAGQLLAAAAPARGVPLLRVRTGAVTRAALRLPWVRAVRIDRRWPGTLVVTVREATAVAALPTAGGVDLVDSAGRRIVHAVRAPTGVPVVTVDTRGGAGAVRAASAVASSLPATLRGQVGEIRADSPDDVRLTLRDGSGVVWGSAGQGQLKARVLEALRALPGTARTYDVSAPRAPATS